MQLADGAHRRGIAQRVGHDGNDVVDRLRLYDGYRPVGDAAFPIGDGGRGRGERGFLGVARQLGYQRHRARELEQRRDMRPEEHVREQLHRDYSGSHPEPTRLPFPAAR
jgi:hypothetical protein